jgi:hypothetical protein
VKKTEGRKSRETVPFRKLFLDVKEKANLALTGIQSCDLLVVLIMHKLTFSFFLPLKTTMFRYSRRGKGNARRNTMFQTLF